MTEKPTAYRASIYAWMVPRITEVARELGYAIGVHGSMHRDLDLIAVPWTEEAKPADELVEAIREYVDGIITATGTEGARWSVEQGKFVSATIENPARKPHGRLAWNIHLANGPFLDISVMPTVQEQPTCLDR